MIREIIHKLRRVAKDSAQTSFDEPFLSRRFVVIPALLFCPICYTVHRIRLGNVKVTVQSSCSSRSCVQLLNL